MASDRPDGVAATGLAFTSSPKRTVVSVPHIAKPDPEFTTVLLRLRDEAGCWLDFEMGAVDAQKLGHALNTAGGGTLSPRPPHNHEPVEGCPGCR